MSSRAVPRLVLALFFGASLSTAQISTSVQSRTADAELRLRTLDDQLLNVYAKAQTGGASDWAAGAETAIHERAAILTDLIDSAPDEAIRLALPPEVLSELATLFPSAAAQVENIGTWEGAAENWVADKRDGSSRAMTFLKLGAETLELHFAAESARCNSAGTLRVSGVRVGNKVAVSSSEMTASAASTGGTCSTTGVQNTVVLMVTFPGVTPPTNVTPQSVYDIFFSKVGNSLDGYWREASYGQTSASGNVYGWYTLSQAYSCSTLDQAVAEAMVMASSAGASFQNGTRIFLIYPKIGCASGFAQVGCSALSTPSGTINASIAYIEADYLTGDQGVYFAIHEGGHNLGLQHAGTVSFGTETLGPLTSTGTSTEFGDNFSAMGSQTLGQYSAQHKAGVLGWMASGSSVQTVQSSGTWLLQPFETGSGLQALKVQRGTGGGSWLWIEYRQPLGTYDSTLYFQQPSGGAFIHYEDPTIGAYTHLLNFAPQLGSWYAPALTSGQTWVDPYTDLSISVQSATPSGMTLNVGYGGSVPCTRADPTISLLPPNPSAAPGSSVSYTIAMVNDDSSGCSSNTYSLGSSQPAGWPTTFSPTSLTLAPGQSGSVTMTKAVPASTPNGVYPVDATAGAATGLANVTVIVPALAVSVSTAASTYSVGQTVSVTARVANGGSAAAGASVTFTMIQPNGAKTSKTVTANSAGTASWNYKIGPKGPRGVYSVTATATQSSLTAISNTASFTVR